MSRKINAHGKEEDGSGNDDDGVTERGKRTNRKKRRLQFDGYNHKRSLKRAKKILLSPLNKFEKLFKGNTRSSSLPPPPPPNSSLPGNTTRLGVSSYWCWCMSKRAQTMDISFDDLDPNDPRISYEYLKSQLENNDFYSKECNTHFVD